MLASKALEEQGSRLVSANCSKEKKIIEAGTLLLFFIFFFLANNTILKEQK